MPWRVPAWFASDAVGNYNFGASSSSLQFYAAHCSSLQLLVSHSVPWLHCPPLSLELLTTRGFLVLFCVLFIYWAYLVYWMVNWVPAQGKQQGVGVWKQTGGKQNWRNCFFQHQQKVFVRGRIGTAFRYAYLLLFSKIYPLWSYLCRDSS